MFRTGKLTVTLDAYQVKIRDRILGTASIFGSGGATNFAIVRDAIVANGNVLDPTVTQTGINIFTNGASTRTRGVELTANVPSDFGSWGKVSWSLSGNYNETKITKLGVAPASLGGIPLFDLSARANLETASPKFKAIASALWTIGPVSATARGTLYGQSSTYASPDGGTYYRQKVPTAFIADLEATYKLVAGIELTAGANNVFNKRPPTVSLVPGTTNTTLVNGGNVIDAPLSAAYGINGGYYYGKVSFKF